jgi:pimeloyl-ACP methyl ester carboxylesterase
MARDALKVLDAARIDRAHVFGFSLGGMVAQELAIRHPDRVRSLVLGSTRAARRAGMPMTIAAMANLVAAGRFSPAKAMAYTAPYLLSEECRRTRPEVVETWQQLVREQPLRRVGVSGQIFAALAHDSVARLPKIRHRTLILTGDTDRLMPPECSRFLARSIAGAKLEFLKGKGHEFCVEAPRETARAIRDFCLAEEQGENAA